MWDMANRTRVEGGGYSKHDIITLYDYRVTSNWWWWGKASTPAVGRSAMHWSCLQFNVLLLPESYRRLPAENKVEAAIPPPTRPGRNLENNIDQL